MDFTNKRDDRLTFIAEFTIIISQEDWKKLSNDEIITRETKCGDKISKIWLTDDELTIRVEG